MKKLNIFLILLHIVFIGAENIHAQSREVYLLPSKPGESSKMLPFTDKASVDWLIQYDGGTSNYYLSALLPGDTLGVFFEPPAACSLVEVRFCKYMWLDNGVYTYHGIVADVPDGVTMDGYGEYHSAASMPGPSAIGSIFAEGDFDFPFTGDWQWDTLVVPGKPDVGENAFWAGTVIADSSHSTRIDAGVDPPYHAIGYKQAGAAPAANGPGWYSSHHLFWVRALVKVYENIGPVITMDELNGTYDTGDRTVEIYTEDFDPDTATLGIDEIQLYYFLGDNGDTIEVDVVQDSLKNPAPGWEYAWWHAGIPGQPAGTKVTYWIEGADGAGAEASTSWHWYKVKEGTPGNGLLYVEGDDRYGPETGVHDAFAGKPFDVWNEIFDGSSDNTVTDFYASGPGGRVFAWLARQWYGLSDFTFTQSFRDFMDGGGCLFLSSQDIPFHIHYATWVAPESPHPLRDYFKAYMGEDDYICSSPFTVTVDNTDILTTGMPEELIVDLTPLYSTWVGIFIELDEGCVPLFFDDEGNILGYRYEDPDMDFKVVWLYFPYHAITDTVAQNTLIANLTSWFELGVEENTEPVVYHLPVVAPNPLSRPTTINFTIPKTEYVSIKIYDVIGSLVATLANKKFTAGTHSLTINSDNLTSGVYFLKMDAGTFSGTRKFLVVK